MGLYTKLPVAIQEVDIIIAGGGTAGCVVASRLADADPELSILVVESGPNNETPTIQYPALFLANLAPGSKTVQFHETKKSVHVADRVLPLPTGSVLGGGSSINLMMYSRAHPCDWDSWGTPGWTAKEILPYLKKPETFHGENAKGIHGNDGPIHVSRGTYGSERVQDEYIAAAEKVGWREVEDQQSVNALWRANRFISPSGRRQDAATCYLHPRLRDGKHPNLHVLVETQVTRVLIDDQKRAVGVEVRPNPLFHKGEDGALTSRIKARRLVVASSGALCTPSLLERSGVGSKKILEQATIEVVVDLPGVGRGYEDHHLLVYPYLNTLDPTDTLDALVFGRMGSFENLIKSNHRILGWNAQEIQTKVRPSDEEVQALGPEFQQAWDKEFKNFPDKPLAIISVLVGFPGDPSLATGDPCLATTCFTLYPFSRGDVHITGPKLGDPVDFETGFFTDEGQLDVKKYVWLYKKQREVIRRMPSYRGEMAQCHPPFPAESGAACTKLTDGPLAADIADIVYSAADDMVIEKWLRENVNTTWHSLGTCKMLARDQLGVVDGNLNVYGVQGLKIADLSIAPHNVAANTNHTALVIGEKAADIFIEELRLGSI
ncbi:hypothetical protein JX265_010387 [Neoarthrinium moseri]|uniref:Glucose-methanol-choline oxidoreductase N-terminal domain-containing protein n=1 Tax=Neoarthrinium moseri TaxID=1658444 RepID=A0A9Q0AKP0_9PEZI|nr:hypothetical protein JX265_010387 [Neoarthrinium moseri]